MWMFNGRCVFHAWLFGRLCKCSSECMVKGIFFDEFSCFPLFLILLSLHFIFISINSSPVLPIPLRSCFFFLIPFPLSSSFPFCSHSLLSLALPFLFNLFPIHFSSHFPLPIPIHHYSPLPRLKQETNGKKGGPKKKKTNEKKHTWNKTIKKERHGFSVKGTT